LVAHHVFRQFVIAVANQDTEKLILVMTENIIRHLEELDHESNAGQQKSLQTSGLESKCDSTVTDEPQSADQQSWTSPATEADDFGLPPRMKTCSSSARLVSTGTSMSPSTENSQNKSQAEDSNQTELHNEVLRLRTEVNSLRSDLRCSEDTVVLLKRHIELNTAADGLPLPSVNPDVFVALVEEIERLNVELEKMSMEGGSNEHVRGPAAETETASGDAPCVSGGDGPPAVQGEAQSTSLDLTLTAIDAAAAVGHNVRQASDGADDRLQLCDELVTKDALLSCDEGAAGDKTTASADPLSAADSNFTRTQRSFLESPAGRKLLRQSIAFSHTPFQYTSAANQQAFAELQAEVERLRRRLELTELENSRLLEQSARESVGSYAVVAPSRPSINSQADLSLSLNESLVKYSASGDVTMAAGFLKKLVNVSVFVLYYITL